MVFAATNPLLVCAHISSHGLYLISKLTRSAGNLSQHPLLHQHARLAIFSFPFQGPRRGILKVPAVSDTALSESCAVVFANPLIDSSTLCPTQSFTLGYPVSNSRQVRQLCGSVTKVITHGRVSHLNLDLLFIRYCT